MTLPSKASSRTTWTIFNQDGPHHLGLWLQRAPRASNGPDHLRFSALQVIVMKPFKASSRVLKNGTAEKMLGQRTLVAHPGGTGTEKGALNWGH